MTHAASRLLLCEAEPGQKGGQRDPWLTLPARGVKHSTCAPPSLPPPEAVSAPSGRNYRFPEPEVNAIHLHQREGLQRGFLPDLGLHAVADVAGPNHLEAQRLAPRRRDEGAAEVDAVANQLRGDERPGGQGGDGSWEHRVGSFS